MRKALDPDYDCVCIESSRMKDIAAARGEPGNIKPPRVKQHMFHAIYIAGAAFAFGVVLVITILR